MTTHAEKSSTPTTSIRVLRYGCKIPSEEIAQQINEQLDLSHQYRKALWHCSCASRALYRQRRSEFFPEIAQLDAELAELSDQIGTLSKEIAATRKDKSRPLTERVTAMDALESQRKPLSARRALVIADLKARRTAAKTDKAFLASVERDKKREYQLRRALRGLYSEMGLYSGSYMLVEAADQAAKGGVNDPVRPHVRAEKHRVGCYYPMLTGSLGIQFNMGRSKAQIMSGKDPSLKIEWTDNPSLGARRRPRATAYYRVRSRDRKGVLIPLQIMYTPQLPDDARIKWAKLVVTKSGPRPIFSLQLTVESASFQRKEVGQGTVVFCFEGEKIRYAPADNLEAVTEYAYPSDLLTRVDSLQSTRSMARNNMLDKIRAWCEEQDDTVVPKWLYTFISRQNDKSSVRGLVGLYHWWKDHRIEGDEALLEELAAWAKQENHLYDWQENARSHFLRARKYAYRLLAAQLRRKYEHIILDTRDLRQREERSQEVDAVALSELRLLLTHSFQTPYVTKSHGDTLQEVLDNAMVKKDEVA